MRRMLLATMGVLIVGSGTAAAQEAPPPPPRPHAEVTVTPDPVVPYEPMTVAVDGVGCRSGEDVTVDISRSSQLTDMVFMAPSEQVTVTPDGQGDWSATVDFPVAYPGDWWVEPGCGAAGFHLTVPTPPGMTLEASPDRVRDGETVELTVTGTGCPGDEVHWELGPSPLVVAWGVAEPDADGSWRSTATFEARPVLEGEDDLHLHAYCGFGDDVWVTYPSGVTVTIEPAAPPPPADPWGWLRRLLCRIFGC